MVGVPGKFKGCETCRRRRVKCSNERPYCQTCVTKGRQCEGYERERVFITGTLETKGRVASHPKKTASSAKLRAKSTDSVDRKPQVSPIPPLSSAWDDHVSLSTPAMDGPVLVTALQTSLPDIVVESIGQDGTAGFKIRLPPYMPIDVHSVGYGGVFDAEARCFVSPASVDQVSGSGSENQCAFLFETNTAASATANPDTWRFASDQMSMVQRLGPMHFNTFPNHYFFVRVYRPTALSVALLNRQATFLSSPDWRMLPWEHHPKSAFDQLFDIMLFLPELFARTDQLLPNQPTLARRAEASELLQTCLSLERQFDAWLNSQREFQSLPYWAADIISPEMAMTFASSYTFRDGNTGLMFVYFWMSQILFHQCIVCLNRAIYQPVIDAYPDMWSNIPSNLQIDETQYQLGREFAANICRGLDYVLENTVQPDLLLAPMNTALDLFRGINSLTQDGFLEIMWLEAFKGRLITKGQQIANTLQAQRWTELAMDRA